MGNWVNSGAINRKKCLTMILTDVQSFGVTQGQSLHWSRNPKRAFFQRHLLDDCNNDNYFVTDQRLLGLVGEWCEPQPPRLWRTWLLHIQIINPVGESVVIQYRNQKNEIYGNTKAIVPILFLDWRNHRSTCLHPPPCCLGFHQSFCNSSTNCRPHTSFRVASGWLGIICLATHSLSFFLHLSTNKKHFTLSNIK